MKLRIVMLIALILSGLLLTALNQAPETSSIQQVECVQVTTGDCVRFPIVSGDTLNGETVQMPDFFTGDYNLVIVPFDREQQEAVIDWLPIMQELQTQYDGLAYYSIGALPDVSSGIRLLISGGMRLALDNDVRDVSVLLYLQDQQAFADSLNISSLDASQLLILNPDGEVIWQTDGTYSEASVQALREQIGMLDFSLAG